MEEQYRKEIAWWFAELGSESEVDNYLALFPELNSRLSKFAVGILKWEIAGLIDITAAFERHIIGEQLQRNHIE